MDLKILQRFGELAVLGFHFNYKPEMKWNQTAGASPFTPQMR
jgi:hypothetical protein